MHRNNIQYRKSLTDRISIMFPFLVFFLSLGFPHRYPSDLHCIWTLKAPPGYKVVGQFTEFDLTESEDCSSDYVQISGEYTLGQQFKKCLLNHFETL